LLIPVFFCLAIYMLATNKPYQGEAFKKVYTPKLFYTLGLVLILGNFCYYVLLTSINENFYELNMVGHYQPSMFIFLFITFIPVLYFGIRLVVPLPLNGISLTIIGLIIALVGGAGLFINSFYHEHGTFLSIHPYYWFIVLDSSIIFSFLGLTTYVAHYAPRKFLGTWLGIVASPYLIYKLFEYVYPDKNYVVSKSIFLALLISLAAILAISLILKKRFERLLEQRE